MTTFALDMTVRQHVPIDRRRMAIDAPGDLAGRRLAHAVDDGLNVFLFFDRHATAFDSSWRRTEYHHEPPNNSCAQSASATWPV